MCPCQSHRAFPNLRLLHGKQSPEDLIRLRVCSFTSSVVTLRCLRACPVLKIAPRSSLGKGMSQTFSLGTLISVFISHLATLLLCTTFPLSKTLNFLSMICHVIKAQLLLGIRGIWWMVISSPSQMEKSWYFSSSH